MREKLIALTSVLEQTFTLEIEAAGMTSVLL